MKSECVRNLRAFPYLINDNLYFDRCLLLFYITNCKNRSRFPISVMIFVPGPPVLAPNIMQFTLLSETFSFSLYIVGKGLCQSLSTISAQKIFDNSNKWDYWDSYPRKNRYVLFNLCLKKTGSSTGQKINIKLLLCGKKYAYVLFSQSIPKIFIIRGKILVRMLQTPECFSVKIFSYVTCGMRKCTFISHAQWWKSESKDRPETMYKIRMNYH